jgi:hypothetical protein
MQAAARPLTRTVTALVSLAFVAAPPPLGAQGRSGLRSVDACTVLTQAEIEQAIGKKVKPQKVPPSQPASIGVSVCMWATADGRRSVSVTTYGPEAVSRTQARTIDTYYESLKTAHANQTGTRAKVLPGVGRKASYFPVGSGNTVLVLRTDCLVLMNVAGLTPDEIAKIARAAAS